MAFGISRIFRSTDIGAPQYNNTVGTLKSVLKAVLVNGYGSIASLGWTVEYEVGNIVVFRMKGGTRMFIRLDDDLAGEFANCTAFTSMSSLDNGTERMPGPIATAPIRKKQGAIAVNTPWVIIGDDAGFYLISKPRYNNSLTDVPQNVWEAIYIGDYISFDIRNKWNFCLLTSYGVGGIHRHAPSTSIPQHMIQRDYLFNKGPALCGVYSQSGTYFGSNWTLNNIGGAAGLLLNGTPLGLPVFVYTVPSYTIMNGVLPGVLDPIGIEPGGWVGAVIADVPMIEVVDDNDNLVIVFYVSTPDGASYTYKGYLGKLMFRVGKGFRNV